MDSLTQITLGAAIGAAFMGRTHGRKVLAIGAIGGLIPDLDVFIPMGDIVSDFTYHRGFSHSLLFSILFTPVLAWLLSKVNYFKIDLKDKKIYITLFLSLWTHALLDAMTIYGTQLWWPLSSPPVGLGSIFIVDLLYSLPLLIGVIGFLAFKSRRFAIVALIISTLYLGWSAAAQYYVYTLAKPQIESEKILVQPTPLNTILWRVLAMTDDGYQVGYYSLFDNSDVIEFKDYKNTPQPLSNSWSVSRLQWFTKGFYGVREEGEDIVFSDLRMGLESTDYVFQFVVNKDPVERFSVERNMGRLSDIWDRMMRDF